MNDKQLTSGVDDYSQPYCGDCLVPLVECVHQEIYKRGKAR